MSTAKSHSEELERELANCQDFLTEAQQNNDATRAMQLLRIFSQLHRDVEKSKLREGKYLDEKAIAAHDTTLMVDLIEKFRKYMDDLYAQRITPTDAWQKLVDEVIGES